MALVTVLLLIGLGFIVVGGLAARSTVSGVRLPTVSGALVGFVGLCQFLLYLASVAPIAILLSFLTIEEDARHRAYEFTHSFRVSLPETTLQVSDVQGFTADATGIESLQAEMSVAGGDGVTTALMLVASGSLWILIFLLLKNAKAVLRSLYDRAPFLADNPRRLRRISALTLAIWLVYVVYTVGMTAYLQSVLQISGGELRLVDVPILTPLLVAGLLLVLAEVFRVGFELKEENAYTV